MNTENNKLIAEFLGYDILSNGYFNYEGEILTSLPEFNSDWNWLMEVVEKILKVTNSDLNFVGKENVKRVELFKYVTIFSSKETVYNSCIEFIKWYNQQKQ